jgi:hypothetical protein
LPPPTIRFHIPPSCRVCYTMRYTADPCRECSECRVCRVVRVMRTHRGLSRMRPTETSRWKSRVAREALSLSPTKP